MDDIGAKISAIIGGIIGLAVLAVLVSDAANTSNVIKSFFGGVSNLIGVAISPVTGQSVTTGQGLQGGAWQAGGVGGGYTSLGSYGGSGNLNFFGGSGGGGVSGSVNLGGIVNTLGGLVGGGGGGVGGLLGGSGGGFGQIAGGFIDSGAF